MASQCYTTGRIEAAVGYREAGQSFSAGAAMAALRHRSWLGGAYIAIGQPERWVELCRAQLARGRDTHAFTRAWLVGTDVAGSGEEAMAADERSDRGGGGHRQPVCARSALGAYGSAFRDADPVRALDALAVVW